MIKHLMKYNSLYICFILLIILTLIYPIYFISDDWEHLRLYHQGLGNQHVLFWKFRVPTLIVLHSVFFPLFVNNHFFIATLTLWSFLLFSFYLIFITFVPNYKEYLSKWWFGFFLIFLSFPCNNFEWSFWPTNMTLLPSLTLMSLGFYYNKKKKTKLSYFLKSFSYVVGFYAYESLLPSAILMELAYAQYVENKNLLSTIISTTKQIALGFILIVGTRIYLQTLDSYGYAANLGFKVHLFQQYIDMLYFHDYYKSMYLTGGLSLLSIFGLLIFRFLKHGFNIVFSRDLFIQVAMLIGSCYYYYIMDYNSRRALAGQIYFHHALISLGFLYTLSQYKTRMIKMLFTLYIISTLSNQYYIFKNKNFENDRIKENVAELQRIASTNDASISISLEQPKTGFKRAWNFINREQLEGYLRHYLPPEQVKKFQF